MIQSVVIGLLVVAVVVLGLLVAALARQVGTVLKHVAPPRPGTGMGGPEPGTKVSLPGAEAGHPAIAVFLSPFCPSCRTLEPALPAFIRHHDLEVVTILVGGSESARTEYASALAFPVRLDLQQVSEEWKIPATPFAVGITSEGEVVASGVVNSLDQLEALADMTLSPPPPSPTVVELPTVNVAPNGAMPTLSPATFDAQNDRR